MAHASMAAADAETLRSHVSLEARTGPYLYEIVRTPDGSAYPVTDGVKSLSIPWLGHWAWGKLVKPTFVE